MPRGSLTCAFLILFVSLAFAQDESNDSAISIGNFHLSGEGGLAFFDTGSDGDFPNSEFRVDEAKLFVEAPLGGEIYVFSEINLFTREQAEENLEIGELYVDFENLSRFWNHEGLLNIRAGRMDIPFGEEYLTRDAIDNPLISHSITDFWGVDEGVEAYGSFQRLHYNLAIQNGGNPKLRDFTSDKSITGHFAYDFPRWAHLSFSAMRTGDLDVTNDFLSALWIGNGFNRSLGSTSTTRFGVNVYLAEAQINWKGGHFRGGAGQLHYHDNDPTADNARDVNFYQFEALQNVDKSNRFQAAMRFGRMQSDRGYPIVGHGNFNRYFFDPTNLTTKLWRLTFGLGYRPNRNVFLKAEYTLEHRKEFDGYERDDENFIGAEVALKF